MLKDYFGRFSDGRLKPGRFIALWLLLVAMFVGCGMAVGASIGLAERLIGGDLAEAQALLRKTLALPAIIVIFVVAAFFVIAKLNIIAKRARDIGLPGWPTAIVFAVLVGGASPVIGGSTSGGIGLVLILVLAFIPTDALR